VGGQLIQKAAPSGEHGDAQAGVVAAVRPPFQRKPGGGGPGGWWIATEVEVLLSSSEVVRPDVLGWRRERSPERPTETPVKLRPAWICEVISQTNATDDTVKKLRLYHGAAIPHYWLVDPRDATMTVMRWSQTATSRCSAPSGERLSESSPSTPSSLRWEPFSVTIPRANSYT
jgi:Uma2 family endonuclease